MVKAQQKSALMGADKKTVNLFFEKTYLHTDRSNYGSGEDIWFSAYLVNGKSSSLTNTSNNLYVELISPMATILDSKNIRMDEGLGKGDFKLKDTLSSGWYTIRAYTNWMRNFGNYFVFDKKVYISNTLGKSFPVSEKSTAKKTVSQPTALPKKSISFFPEGGSLVEGLSSILAFKTNDEFGNGLEATASLISSKGDTVTSFQSSLSGMGFFSFMPLVNETYHVEGYFGEEKFTARLPLALKNGLALHVNSDSSSLKINVSATEGMLAEAKGQPISIQIKHAGNIVYTGTVLLNKTNVFAVIPTKDLPSGIAVLTILDHLGRPSCERLVYIQTPAKVKFSLNANKTVYSGKEKVTLQIKATDNFGQPVASSFSLAVTDELGLNEAPNIVAYLMLQSEIIGEIKTPNQYFDQKNPRRFKQLDLLLLTQGWRNYLWRKLADSNLKISYLPEPGISIRGTVREKLADKPMPNMNITLFGSNFSGNKIFFTKTDTNGAYFLDGLSWYGNQALKLVSQDNKGKKGGWLQIDTLVKPLATQLKFNPQLEVPLAFNSEMNKRMAYNRTYKTGDSIVLDEVKIVNQKPERLNLFDQTSTTFGYPDQVFNISAADHSYRNLEHYLLTNVNGAQSLEDTDSLGNEGITFLSNGNRIRPRILINNSEDLFDRIDYYRLSLDQINQITVKHLLGQTGDDVFVIALNLKESALRGPNLNMLNVNLNGYYSARAFYSPNYEVKPTVNKDLRTTIFWSPKVKTNANGEATVSFFNSDNKGNVSININGIADKGIAIDAKATYIIQ